MAIKDAVYAVNEITEKIEAGVPAVKQVISGTYTFSSTADATIQLPSTINPDKTVVILNTGVPPSGGGTTYDYADILYSSALIGKTATSITISPAYALLWSSATSATRKFCPVSYQIIEFY